MLNTPKHSEPLDFFSKCKIPHSRPSLSLSEEIAISSVIFSDQLSQGQEVEMFETEFAQKFGFKYAVAVSSGTAALYLTLRSLNLAGNVIIPSFTCSSLYYTTTQAGLNPVLTDCDLNGNITSDHIIENLNSDTVAIIIPHMFGLPVKISKEISDLGLPIIEDCSQSMSTHTGVASIYSFYTTKLLATGEGGMVATNDLKIANEVRDLRDFDEKQELKPYRFNFKMSDLHATIGREQLKKFDFFIHKRKEIAKIYHNAFKDLEIQCPLQDDNHIYFRYVIRHNVEIESFINCLSDMGIVCRKPIFKPIHNYLNFTDFPISDKNYKEMVSIPIYPNLTQEEINFIINTIKSLVLF